MKAQYEKIEPQEFHSFKAYSYEKAEFDTPWHYHPEYELTYILSGRGIRYVGNEFENFEEDDLVLLGPNLPHCWRNVGTQTGNSSAIVMHWENDLLGNKREFDPIAQMFAKSTQGIKFDMNIRERLLDMLQQPPFDRFITFLSILNELATQGKGTILSTASVNDSFLNHDHQRINTVYQFVRNNYREKVTLTQIASEVYMSEEAFSRFFSKVMNKPFFTFLNEYRINAACQLLIETEKAVSEVALESGFETLPFFYRQFGKFKNISPKKFRDKYRKSLMFDVNFKH